VWDFTCKNTLALSHLVNTSRLAGAAASVAETRKVAKYSALSLRKRGPGAMEFFTDLGSRLAVYLCEPQAFCHLRQGLDIAIQRGNAISVLGKFQVIFTKMVSPFSPA